MLQVLVPTRLTRVTRRIGSKALTSSVVIHHHMLPLAWLSRIQGLGLMDFDFTFRHAAQTLLLRSRVGEKE